MWKQKSAVCLLALLLLNGCGGTEEVYKRESFELDSPYQFFTQEGVEIACESARRALLGQGYIIDSADAGAVRARKSFRTTDDESTVLEMNITCTSKASGAVVFANAVQSRYSVKKSSQSASVGVPVLGSISVPIKGSSDSMVKTGDDTVNDREFYRRFFTVVEFYLEQVAAGVAPHPAQAPIAAETPGAAPGQSPAFREAPKVGAEQPPATPPADAPEEPPAKPEQIEMPASDSPPESKGDSTEKPQAPPITPPSPRPIAI